MTKFPKVQLNISIIFKTIEEVIVFFKISEKFSKIYPFYKYIFVCIMTKLIWPKVQLNMAKSTIEYIYGQKLYSTIPHVLKVSTY